MLVPLLLKALYTPLAATGMLEAPTAFLVCYCVYCFAAIEFSLMALFRLLRLWFDASSSLMGIMMFCLMLGVAARDHYFQPWTLIEIGFFATAILLAVGRRWGWALALTIAATLNRETGLFVPMLFCAGLPGHWFDRKRIAWLAILGFTGFAIVAGVHLMIGPKPNPYPAAHNFYVNLLPKSLAHTFLAILAFLSISWPAVLGWTRAPIEIRRCAAILPLYATAILFYSMWWEVRLWLPVACIVLPLAVSGVQALVSGPGLRRPNELRPQSRGVSQI